MLIKIDQWYLSADTPCGCRDYIPKYLVDCSLITALTLIKLSVRAQIDAYELESMVDITQAYNMMYGTHSLH